MSIQRYQNNIQSGVEWLGETPSTWTIKRLGYFFDERREKVSDTVFKPLSVTKNGIVPQLETAAKSDDGDNRKKVCKGDFVINSRSDRKGSSGASPLTGSVSLINTVIVPKKDIDIKFAHHLFRSTSFQEEYYRYGKGIVADLWSTNYSEMKNISIPVPPLNEQSKIAAFPEDETAKIDKLVAEQEKLIELLKEKRQAVISHAVTKGVDLKVKMKDSGLEWLGEIPENWNVERIRRFVKLNPSKSELGELDKKTEVSFLPMEAIGEEGALSLEKTKPLSEVESGYTYFREGDVTIAKITPCFENGKGAVMKGLHNGFGFGTTELIVARPIDGKVTSDFLYRLFSSTQFRKNAEGSMYGAGGQKRVPDEFIREFQAGLPPVNDQIKITEFLDYETAKFESLIKEATSVISLLNERRSALISAAVTGQIDVRNYQSKEIA